MANINIGRILPIPKGEYNDNTTYEMLDIVYYEGNSYVAKQTTKANKPTNTSYWAILTEAHKEYDSLLSVINNQLGQITYYDIKNVGFMSATKAIATNADWRYTDYIPLSEGQRFTYKSDAQGGVPFCIYFDSAKNIITYDYTSVTGTDGGEVKEKTIIVPSNYKYAVVNSKIDRNVKNPYAFTAFDNVNDNKKSIDSLTNKYNGLNTAVSINKSQYDAFVNSVTPKLNNIDTLQSKQYEIFNDVQTLKTFKEESQAPIADEKVLRNEFNSFANYVYPKITEIEENVNNINNKFNDEEINAEFTEGHYLNQLGQKVANSTAGLFTTDYIAVREGYTVTYRLLGGTSHAMFILFDKDKKAIKIINHTGKVLSGSFFVDKDTKYLMAGYHSTDSGYYVKIKTNEYRDVVNNVNDLIEDKKEIIDNYNIVYSWRDLASNTPLSYVSGTGKKTNLGTTIQQGIQFKNAPTASTWVYVGFKLKEKFKPNHKYYVAIKMHLTKDTKAPTEGSQQGNMNYSNIDFRQHENTNTVVSNDKTNISTIITQGNTADLRWTMQVGANPLYEGDRIRWQLGQYGQGESVEFNILSLCVLDLTELNITTTQAEELLISKGYNQDDEFEKVYNIVVKKSLNGGSEQSNNNQTSSDDKPKIEIWGDSLVAQGYGHKYLSPMLGGRQVLTKGYGGKKSTYIRDQFLQQADVNKTIIINVGRNNYNEWDVILDDIKRMVAAIPHYRFLICMPPTGHWNEGLQYDANNYLVPTTAYNRFVKLRDKLQREYASNFLDTWSATIEEYDNGGVTLTHSFVKPTAIGGETSIQVTDGEFLTTYNSGDVTRWGEEFMKQIVVGKSLDAVDVYKVIGRSGNQLRCLLQKSGSDFALGATVNNQIDDGGTNSIKYLRVMQYADYDCYIKNVTQSTFRSDGIHMTERGQECLAKVIARKITQMGI